MDKRGKRTRLHGSSTWGITAVSGAIYADHNATTPLRPEALAAMLPFLGPDFGNASSVHGPGRRAAAAVDDARDRVAALIGAKPAQVVFTSGGTESDNTAIWGVFDARRDRGRHLITTAVEHKAVLDPCRYVERMHGARVTRLPVDDRGRLDPDSLRAALTPETVLVSVMLANNEVGNLYPVAELAEIAHAAGALFHTDAVQAVGKVPVDVGALGCDLLSVSAHKLYGPKGTGALYVRKGVPFEPLLHGGGQERGRRCGTYNTPGIVGFGIAAELASRELAAEIPRLSALRDRLQGTILGGVDGVWVNGDPEARLPGTLHLGFEGLEGESLLMSLDLRGVAVSSGSACSSGSLDPSHVLVAMGQDRARTRCTLRFALGRTTEAAEVDAIAEAVIEEATRLREIAADGKPPGATSDKVGRRGGPL